MPSSATARRLTRNACTVTGAIAVLSLLAFEGWLHVRDSWEAP